MSPLSSTGFDGSGCTAFFARELSRAGSASFCAIEVERFGAGGGLVETEKRPIAIPKQKAITPIAIETLPSGFIVTKIVDLLVQLLKRKKRAVPGSWDGATFLTVSSQRLGAD
jgi:hypothetical protein